MGMYKVYVTILVVGGLTASRLLLTAYTVDSWLIEFAEWRQFQYSYTPEVVDELWLVRQFSDNQSGFIVLECTE